MRMGEVAVMGEEGVVHRRAAQGAENGHGLQGELLGKHEPVARARLVQQREHGSPLQEHARGEVGEVRLAAGLAELPRDAPLPPRFVGQARSLALAFATDEATDGRLIHTDLHYANVLANMLAGAAGHGGEWSAIDPKPLSGDPHYEVAPLLWNRWAELDGRVREGIRDRFFAVVDAAGLDEERARDWVVVRMLDLARQRLEDPPSRGRRTPTAELLTMCVTIAKAVQG